jgi:lipopolysaccharide/colanic/teichoic acid biosynthesis glycosyltransferase
MVPRSDDAPAGRHECPSPGSHTLKRSGWLQLKYGLDPLIAIGLLMILLPVLAVCAVWIRLTSRGSIFVTEWQVGEGGRRFVIHRFRMRDAGTHRGQGAHAKRLSFRAQIDSCLRRFHVEKLPQLVNVIRGDMSLVGPRPRRPEEVERFSAMFRQFPRRLAVRPGITGLAQICLRRPQAEEDVRRELVCDLLYLRKLSLARDLSILFLTLGQVTRKDRD